MPQPLVTIRRPLDSVGVRSGSRLKRLGPIAGPARFAAAIGLVGHRRVRRQRAVTRPLRRYDLGFDMASLQARPRIARGLVAGSNAAIAGWRDGDEILNGLSQDAMQGDQCAVVSLDVQRAGRSFPPSYRLRGEVVPAYQWKPVTRSAREARAR